MASSSLQFGLGANLKQVPFDILVEELTSTAIIGSFDAESSFNNQSSVPSGAFHFVH